MIIDTHCHINGLEYENLGDLVNSLKDVIVINSGIDSCTNQMVLDLTKNPNFYATIGYHPENIDNIEENYIELLEKNLTNPKVVAIGEIGLDYHWRQDNKEKQKEVFINQLKLAKKYHKPVIIHSRDAINDVYEILKEYSVKSNIHCFNSSKEMAEKFIENECFIGVGGVITFKNARKLVEIVKEIPIDKILLETDSPYLSPEPLRGTKNTPRNLKYIVQRIAEIKNIETEELIRILNNNACIFFNIKML